MKSKITYKMIVCALFAALAFVGTLIQIPLPSGGMVHLGNFVCIIAALLCGGVIGGLAGGIGCGLFDLIIYSSWPGFFQYFILKFVMGFLVGTLFRYIVNNRKKVSFSLLLGVLGAILAVLTTLVVVFYNLGKISLSSSITKKNLYIGIVLFFGYVFSILLIISGIFSSKLKKTQKTVLFVATISVILNVVLEFIWKLGYNKLIEDLTINGSLIKAVSSMPSCILTGSLTVTIVTLIYDRMYNATKSINQLNDLKMEEYQNEE